MPKNKVEYELDQKMLLNVKNYTLPEGLTQSSCSHLWICFQL